MAKLSDFLGSVVSSISDARVNSDVQSLRIAEEYAKNDLLKHFSVPRMRIDKVELHIPVAVDSLSTKTQRSYQSIDSSSFSIKAYQQILKSLAVPTISSEASKQLIATIADQTSILESKIKANQIENSLEEFAKGVTLKTIKLVEGIYKENNKKRATKTELAKLQINTEKELQSALAEEFVLQREIEALDSVQFIVEAHKLREIKPENVITIKVTISEQGMEWVNMEDKDGKVVNKLMPE
jgi:hypothetical protein